MPHQTQLTVCQQYNELGLELVIHSAISIWRSTFRTTQSWSCVTTSVPHRGRSLGRGQCPSTEIFLGILGSKWRIFVHTWF